MPGRSHPTTWHRRPIDGAGITLEYGSDDTGLINFDSSAATVQATLETIASLTGNVSVNVTVDQPGES